MSEQGNQLNVESELFRDIKLITTLLIKNGSKLYRFMLPLVQTYEDKSWASKTETEKQSALSDLKTRCFGEGEINRFFEDFPHDWTRRKYSEFKQNLNRACAQD